MTCRVCVNIDYNEVELQSFLTTIECIVLYTYCTGYIDLLVFNFSSSPIVR